MIRRTTLSGRTFEFPSLADLLAKATPARSGDVLADLPLATFLEEQVVGYDEDDVTRLILDTHDAGAFKDIAHLTVGDFREFPLVQIL